MFSVGTGGGPFAPRSRTRSRSSSASGSFAARVISPRSSHSPPHFGHRSTSRPWKVARSRTELHFTQQRLVASDMGRIVAACEDKVPVTMRSEDPKRSTPQGDAPPARYAELEARL